MREEGEKIKRGRREYRRTGSEEEKANESKKKGRRGRDKWGNRWRGK